MEFLLNAANRGSVSTGYDIENSILIDADTGEEMYYTTGSSSSDQQKGTFSFWIKRGRITYGNFSPMQINDYGAPYHAGCYFGSGSTLADRLYWNHKDNSSQWTAWMRVFRDPAAWYHIVVVIDTTQADGDDRHRMYVNGGSAEDIKDTNGHNAPVSQNDNYFWFDNGRKMTIGGISTGDAYIADYHYIDGQVKAPSDFGEFDEDTNIWKPKAYSGSHGNNGFHLKFESSGSLGTDSSGNGNNFSLTNIDAGNQMTDSPTNNFATLNPLASNPYDDAGGGGNIRIAPVGAGPGNLQAGHETGSFSQNYVAMYGTIALSKGKWYWEVTDNGHGFNTFKSGVKDANMMHNHDEKAGSFFLSTDGTFHKRGGSGAAGGDQTGDWSGYEGSLSANDVIGMGLDMDNKRVYIYNNNTLVKDSAPYYDVMTQWTHTVLQSGWVVPFHWSRYGYQDNCFNFGQGWAWLDNSTSTIKASNSADGDGYGKFRYTPPTGFYAICSKNLAEYG